MEQCTFVHAKDGPQNDVKRDRLHAFVNGEGVFLWPVVDRPVCRLTHDLAIEAHAFTIETAA